MYRTTFAQAKAPAKGARVMLDLGRVAVVAEVMLNGKDLGVLWQQPFRMDIARALTAGDNTLEVKVTNLLVNRMIGDEFLPKGVQDTPDGALLKVPQWVIEGKPSPTGRFTFATIRMWKKDEALQESGLLGPVTLWSGVRVEAAPLVNPSKYD